MNQTDIHPEMLHPYDPRVNPLPVPEVDICAGPVHTICINAEWWSHLSGMVARLTYRDAWLGTDNEVHDAIESIYKILNVGKPTMSCGCGCGNDGQLTRYNGDGVFQVSNDGGATWTDAPNQDPRNNVTQAPPPVIGEGEDGKCKAANSGVAWFIKEQQDNLKLVEAGAGIAEFGAQIIAFMIATGLAVITGGAGIVLLGAINAFLVGVIASEFEGAFNDAYWDKFLCALYCNMGDDLSFSEAQFQAVKSEMLTESNILARTWMDKFLYAIGAKGLTNAIRLGALGTKSCDSCGCGGCDLTAWSFFDSEGGITVTKTETYWEIQAVPRTGSSLYYVIIKSPNALDCCAFTAIELTSGATTERNAWTHCGDDPDSVVVGLYRDYPLGTGTNGLLYQSAVPFTIAFSTAL